MTEKRRKRAQWTREAKDVRIDLLTSLSERELFEDAADCAGLSLSAWIRTRLRKAAANELPKRGR